MSPYFVEKKSVKYSDYFEKKKKKKNTDNILLVS